MIAYFSGTGNSLYLAKELSEATHDSLVSLAKESLKDKNPTYEFKDGERLGIVFPIHSWGAPEIVLDWIKNSTFKFKENSYVYVINTCGEDVGNAIKAIKKIFARKNLKMDLSYSVKMPNNYMIMGDVYNDTDNERILKDSQIKIKEIARLISSYSSGVEALKTGKFPHLKTNVINPLFNKFAIDAKSFNVNSNCTSCGICQSVCPTRNISLIDNIPKWGDKCTQCLACINYCPYKAINFGEKTINKGRYTNPYIDISQMKNT